MCVCVCVYIYIYIYIYIYNYIQPLIYLYVYMYHMYYKGRCPHPFPPHLPPPVSAVVTDFVHVLVLLYRCGRRRVARAHTIN